MGTRTRNRASGGFTLVEMLVVVAIIAVLVVVSIPLVSASLEDAREAADAANERAAKAAAVATYLLAGKSGNTMYAYTGDGTVVEVTSDAALLSLYGDQYTYGQSEAHKDDYVYVTISYDSEGNIGAQTHWHESKSF